MKYSPWPKEERHFYTYNLFIYLLLLINCNFIAKKYLWRSASCCLHRGSGAVGGIRTSMLYGGTDLCNMLLWLEFVWKPEAYPIPGYLAGRSASVSRDLPGSLADFFRVKPCTEDLLPMRIGLWQGIEREPAPAQAARARCCLQETAGMRLDVTQVPACPPPQLLQGFARFVETYPIVETYPTLVWGGERIQMQPMLRACSQEIAHIYKLGNGEATVMIVCKLSLLSVWINDPLVEQFTLLEFFFLPSLLHFAPCSLEPC